MFSFSNFLSIAAVSSWIKQLLSVLIVGLLVVFFGYCFSRIFKSVWKDKGEKLKKKLPCCKKKSSEEAGEDQSGDVVCTDAPNKPIGSSKSDVALDISLKPKNNESLLPGTVLEASPLLTPLEPTDVPSVPEAEVAAQHVQLSAPPIPPRR